jgi:rare lipoprotein A
MRGLIGATAVAIAVSLAGAAPGAEARCQTHKCWHRVSLRRHREFPKHHPGRYRSAWSYSQASWYGPGFYGNRTACGVTLSGGSMIVAHRTMACGTRLEMCAARCAVVTVGDRGPYVYSREFDLAPGTKAATGFGSTGIVRWRLISR